MVSAQVDENGGSNSLDLTFVIFLTVLNGVKPSLHCTNPQTEKIFALMIQPKLFRSIIQKVL